MNYLESYVKYLSEKKKISRPLKIVCDTSNGTAIIPAREVLKDVNLDITFINDNINASFSAHGPNPLTPGAAADLSQKILELKADLGIIFDGDGDRVFFVDEKGNLLPSAATAFVLFKHFDPPYVCDELVFKLIEQSGLIQPKNLIPSKVGSRFIKEKMKEFDTSFGAEFSGHFYFKEFFGADSGLFGAITMLNVLASDNQKLSILSEPITQFNITDEKVDFDTSKWQQVEKAVLTYAQKTERPVATRDGITFEKNSRWYNIRPSNTEPIVRITHGGRGKECDKETLEEVYQILKSF